MTFKDELNNKVIEARERIKTKAINYFIDWLKIEMSTSAEEGKTAGYINLEDEENVDGEYVNEIYNKLRRTLIIEDVFDHSDKVKIYNWLLSESKKTDIFKDINIEIENSYLNFNW